MEMKERIQQKAEELFYRYGIRSVTMDEIAGQLGISKKTIYQSFADKEELVFAVFNKHMIESKDCCVADKEAADNAVHEIFLALDMMEDMLKTLNPYILYDLEKFHPAVFQKFKEYKNDFLYKMIMENLERGIAEELYRPDIDVEILTRFRIGTLMLSANVDIFPKNKFTLIEVEKQLLLHFLHGVTTTKGGKLMQKYLQQREQKKSLTI